MYNFFGVIYIVYMSSCFFQISNVEGAYKLKLLNLKKCKTPEDKFDKTVSLTYNISTRKINRNTSYMNINYYVEKKAGPVFLNFRSYQLKQNMAKDLIFQSDKMKCKNPVTFQLIKIIGIKLTEDCYTMAANYTVEKINIDDFKWLIPRSVVEMGRYAYESTFVTDKGIIACVEISFDIFEIK